MTKRADCRKLANRLGCDLEYRRARYAKQVDIELPAGMQVEGNPGLNRLHHECGLDEDIWPGVLDDLKSLDGGMEPLDERYAD